MTIPLIGNSGYRIYLVMVQWTRIDSPYEFIAQICDMRTRGIELYPISMNLFVILQQEEIQLNIEARFHPCIILFLPPSFSYK